jgi:hypothetical protein
LETSISALCAAFCTVNSWLGQLFQLAGVPRTSV